MAEQYIVGMEISKKQNYIFKSKRLKEIIGASRIIRMITEYLPKKYLDTRNEIYSGGGNSFFKFETENSAKEFISKISLDILRFFPEIEVFFSINKMENTKGNVLKDSMEKLEKKKSERRSSFKKISFGLEEICENSKYPAFKIIPDDKNNDKNRFVSLDTFSKFEFGNDNDNIKERIKKILDNEIIENNFYKQEIKFDYKYISDFDGFEDKVAIISLDGNRMAELVTIAGERIEELSKIINTSYKKAYSKVVEYLEEKIGKSELLPIRNLILAGDDVCYIIEAKYALDSIRIFLEELHNSELEKIEELKNKRLTACAGIVIANNKYPFSVAYDMAEELNKDSKAKLRETGETEASLFTFEVIKGEITGSEYKYNKLNDFYISISCINKSESEEIIDFKDFSEILSSLNIDKENEDQENRVGKIKEILSSEFDVNYFNIQMNKYILKNDFKKLFRIEETQEIFTAAEYTKAVKIIEMLKYY